MSRACLSRALLSVVRSLRFTSADPASLRSIGDAEWRKVLALTDRSQLTLPLGVHCREHLPEWVRSRIDGNLANNAIRQARIAEVYTRIATALEQQGLEFIVLKGFSHHPLFCPDLRYRPQYDLDVFFLPGQIERAYAAIMALGYEPFGVAGRSATDHLPPLILKTGWRPKDDYYDPDIPITIEVHFRYWDEDTEHFAVSSADGFWARKEVRETGYLVYPALHPADAFSYAAWHLVRHLVRGDARAYHVYELAHYLHATAEDDASWNDWRDGRPAPLVEAIACRLAAEWFGCRVNPVIRELLRTLPRKVERWFEMFAFSPLLALHRPNKDELFLHLALVDKPEHRVEVVKRRLFPRRSSPYIADVHVASPDLRLRVKRRAVGAAFLANRTFHHMRTLAPLAWNGIRWRRALAASPQPQSDRTLPAETARP
jgi:hypothetical protein